MSTHRRAMFFAPLWKVRPCMTVMQNCVTEYTFQSQKNYADPFSDIELSVFFAGPDGAGQTVPCFWGGGNEWRVRYSSPTTGTYRYESRCSDTADDGLHGKTGELESCRTRARIRCSSTAVSGSARASGISSIRTVRRFSGPALIDSLTAQYQAEPDVEAGAECRAEILSNLL